jgi:hypothetical protein
MDIWAWAAIALVIVPVEIIVAAWIYKILSKKCQ